MKKKLFFLFTMLVCIFIAGTILYSSSEKEGKEKPVKLVMWVGGQWEFPDAPYFEWFEKMADKYHELNPNITVEMVALADETYFTQTTAAAEAKSHVDISYCWPGIMSMQFVWKGYFEPMNNWIPMEELENNYGVDQRLFDGDYYGYGYYVAGKPMFYNKKILRASGVEAKDLEKWDDFIVACEKIKMAGYIPVTLGGGDGWYGGYHVGDFGSQTLTESDIMAMSIGERSFTEKPFLIMFDKLAELRDKGYLNPDAGTIGLFPGWEAFQRGEAATVFACDGIASQYLEALGDDLGIATLPSYGDLPTAGGYVFESQGAVMMSWSEHKREAADFLMWLHTPEIMEDCFKETGVIFPHKKFPAHLLKGDPVLEYIWSKVSAGDYAPWMENYYPVMVDEQGAFAQTPGFLLGEISAMEFCQKLDEIAKKWRESNPDEYEKFKQWMKDF